MWGESWGLLEGWMPVKETKPHDTGMTAGVDSAQANPALRPAHGHKRCRPWGKGGRIRSADLTPE